MTIETKDQIKSVAVYCASSELIDVKYKETADRLGLLIAQKNLRLVNGAGNMGLMARTADAVLRAGGKVTGIIPQFMIDNGWCHTGLTKLEVVDDMSTRKMRMAELADGIVALPGGVGTLEELIEVITLKQLGLINAPIIIVNIDNYYAPLLQMFERAIEENFMHKRHNDLWQVATSADEAMELLLGPRSWDPSFKKFAKL